MSDRKKTKAQLIEELQRLRQQITELQESENERKRAEEGLRESEERLETILNSVQTGIVVMDAETHVIIDANPVAIEMIGMPKEQVVGRVCHEFICPAEEGKCPITDLGQSIDRSERVLLNASGERIPILKSVVPTILGGRRRLLESFFDITERKWADEALAHERDLLQALMDNIPDTIYFKDTASRFTRINRAQAQTMGINDPAEAIGKTDFDFFTAEHARDAYADEQEIVKSGQPLIDKVERIRRADGQIRWVSATKVPIRDREGRVTGVVGISRDITERKRAEEALAEERNLLRTLIDNLPDLVYAKDAESRFVIGNIAVARLMGATKPDELLGKTDFDFYPQELAAQYYTDDQEIIQLGQPLFSREEPLVDQVTGERGWLSTTKVPLRDSDGQVVGLVGIGRDITERKRAEEALRESEENFRALADNANDGIMIAAGKGAHVYANRRMAEITGYSVPELLKTTMADLVHPDQLKEVMEKYQKRLEGKPAPSQYEIVFIRKDGKSVPLEMTSAKTVWRGQPATIVVFRDITERKAAEAERERLLAALAHRAVQLQTATEVSSAASSILDADELIQQVVDLARERFDLYYAGLFLLDEEQQFAVLRAGTGKAGRKMLEAGHKLEVGGESMIGWCIANAQARIALDVGEEAVRFDNPLLPETRSEMALPLVSRGQVIGAMTIQSAQSAAFSEEDIAALQTMADQLANAIENARLFESQAERAAQIALINDVMRKAASILDLETLLRGTVKSIQQSFNYYHVAVLLVDGATDDLVLRAAASGFGEAIPEGYRQAVGTGMIGWAAQTGQTQLANDTSQDPHYVAVGEWAPLSELSVPIRLMGRVVGVLDVESEQRNAFTEEDVTTMETLADQLAVAIANARAFERERRRADQLRVVNEVGRTVASILDVDALLGQVVRLIRDTFDYYQVNLGLVEGGAVVPKAWAGALSEFPAEDARLNLDAEAIVTRVAASGVPMLVPDVRREPSYLLLPGLEEVKSELTVPLKFKGRVIGVLDVESDRLAAFDERDLTVLEALASQIAVAVENARLFEQTQQTSFLMGLRVKELACLNDIGRKIEEAPPIPEFLQWVAGRIPSAMQYPSLCLAAIEFKSQVYGAAEAVRLPCQIVQALRIGGQVVGRLYISYTEEYDFVDEESALLGDIVRRVSGYIQSRRLFEQTQDRAEELAVLNELGQALTARLSVEEVLNEAYRQATRLVDATNFYIGLYDPERDEVAFVLDVSESEIDKQITVMPASQGITGYIIRNRTSLLFEENVRERQKELGIEMIGQEPQSWLGVPLMIGDQVLGVMTVQSFTTPRLYDEHDRDLLTAIASPTAIALQNAYLFEETEAALTEMENLAEALRVSEERFALALRGSNDGLWDWDIVNNTLYWSPRLKELLGYADDELDVGFDTFETRLHPDDKERMDAAIEVHLKDGTLYDVEQRLLAKSGEYRWFRARGQAIWDENGQPLRMAGSTTDITERKQAEAERERLLAETENLAGELAVLNEMGRALTVMLDVDAVIESIYHYTSRLMDTTNFYVALYDAQQDEVRFPLYAEGEQIRQAGSRRVGKGLTEYVIRTREPLLIEENISARLEELGCELIGQEAQSWLGVPMTIGEQVIGVIAVQSYTTARLYEEHHRDLLSAVASQAAIAIENARLFKLTQTRAERERLVRTITDRVRRGADTEAIMRIGLRELSQLLGTDSLIVRLGTRAQLCPEPLDSSTELRTGPSTLRRGSGQVPLKTGPSAELSTELDEISKSGSE